MGVPKRRVSKARQGDRRAHHALSLPRLEECPHCRQSKRPHHACPHCGWYGGREVVQLKSRNRSEGPAAQ
jgi:large subunit ribosomal protein L32